MPQARTIDFALLVRSCALPLRPNCQLFEMEVQNLSYPKLDIFQGENPYHFGISENDALLFEAEWSYSEAVVIIRVVKVLRGFGLCSDSDHVVEVLKMLGWDEASISIPLVPKDLIEDLVRLVNKHLEGRL